MNIIDKINEKQIKPDVPEFRVGDTVKVDVKIIEGNRERIQTFEGVVVARRGGSVSETFTVRKMSSGVGVERTFQFIHQKLLVLQLYVEVKLDVLNLHSLKVWLADTVLKKEDNNKNKANALFFCYRVILWKKRRIIRLFLLLKNTYRLSYY